MTHAERNRRIKAAIKRYTEIHTRTREAAVACLIREGFLLADGSLNPNWYGPQP